MEDHFGIVIYVYAQLEIKKRALLKAQQECFQLGLTTVDIAGLSKSDVSLIDHLQQTGELKIKVYAMLSDSKENFEDHLKSDDFFDVDNHPTSKLVFNKSSINEKGEKQISCTLDMHGVEVDYLIPFKLAEIKVYHDPTGLLVIKDKEFGYGSVGYRITGEFLMDRTKHELKYGSGTFIENLGDKAINDEVRLSFEFIAI